MVSYLAEQGEQEGSHRTFRRGTAIASYKKPIGGRLSSRNRSRCHDIVNVHDDDESSIR